MSATDSVPQKGEKVCACMVTVCIEINDTLNHEEQLRFIRGITYFGVLHEFKTYISEICNYYGGIFTA